MEAQEALVQQWLTESPAVGSAHICAIPVGAFVRCIGHEVESEVPGATRRRVMKLNADGSEQVGWVDYTSQGVSMFMGRRCYSTEGTPCPPLPADKDEEVDRVDREDEEIDAQCGFEVREDEEEKPKKKQKKEHSFFERSTAQTAKRPCGGS